MSDMNKKITVGIIDLKINNIFSVYRGCERAGFKTEIINFKRKKLIYDIVILPGVGAFKYGIQFLKQAKSKPNSTPFEATIPCIKFSKSL